MQKLFLLHAFCGVACCVFFAVVNINCTYKCILCHAHIFHFPGNLDRDSPHGGVLGTACTVWQHIKWWQLFALSTQYMEHSLFCFLPTRDVSSFQAARDIVFIVPSDGIFASRSTSHGHALNSMSLSPHLLHTFLCVLVCLAIAITYFYLMQYIEALPAWSGDGDEWDLGVWKADSGANPSPVLVSGGGGGYGTACLLKHERHWTGHALLCLMDSKLTW